MELLCIGFKGEIDEVSHKLDNKINIFQKEDLDIAKKIKIIGDTTFLRFFLDDDKKCMYSNIKSIFKHYIASGISDIVLELYQEKIIDRFISDKCPNFDMNEKEKIKYNALEYLNKNDFITTEGIMYKISKKARILKSILEYLDSNNEIIIEGFVNFRLKFFTNMIEEAIDKAIEDYIIEKEYREFIKILQYFVDIQQPKIDLVNIVIENDKYTLYDDKLELIKNDFMEEIADDLMENDMNNDDLLISSLITIAPNKIVIHPQNRNINVQIIDIIKNIFTNKITICDGCELCRNRIKGKNKINKEK